MHKIEALKDSFFIDFGLSNCLDERDFLNTQCGSPAYAAPESIKKYLNNYS